MTAKKNKQLKQSGPADNVSVNITEKLKATAKELVNAWAAVDGDDLYTHGISKIRIQCQDAAFASRCIQHIRVVAETMKTGRLIASTVANKGWVHHCLASWNVPVAAANANNSMAACNTVSRQPSTAVTAANK